MRWFGQLAHYIGHHPAAALGTGMVACGLGLGFGLSMSLVGPEIVVIATVALVGAVSVVVRPFVGLCALPLVTAVGNPSVPGLPFGLQPVHLAMGAVVGAALIHLARGRELGPGLDLGTRRSVAAMCAFVLALVVCTLASTTPYISLNVTITWTAAIAVAVLVAVTLRNRQEVRLLLCMVTIASILSIAPAFTQTSSVSAELGGTVVSNRPTGAFVDPNELGAYCVVMLVLALAVMCLRDVKFLALGAVAASFALLGLILSFSRGSWLAGGAAVLIFVMAPWCRSRVAVWVGSLAVSGSVTAATVGINLPVAAVVSRVTSLFSGASNPYDVRPKIWEQAFEMFWANPILGAGPGSFTRVASDASGSLWRYPLRHAHNGLLTVAAETGVVGVTALVAVVVFVAGGLLRACFFSRRFTERDDWVMAWGLLVALIGAGATLLLDYTLRNPLILMNMWLVVGLGVAWARVGSRERQDAAAQAALQDTAGVR